MTNSLSWFLFYHFFSLLYFSHSQDFCAKYRLSSQPQSISIDCFFLNKLSLKTSKFDSPKKEKRPPRKWRAKNYNKEVKTTLQVCGETTDIYETVLVCVWLLLLCRRYPAASPLLVSTLPTLTSPPPRSPMTRLRPGACTLPVMWPSYRRNSVAWPRTVSYVWWDRIHWAHLPDRENTIIIWLSDYRSNRVNCIMWHALSDNSCYQITRKRINAPRFLPNTLMSLCKCSS